MHWGCFVWTRTLPLSGRMTPLPGPVRVCVCVLSRPGREGRPPRRVLVHLTFSFGCSWCSLCLLGSLRARVALLVVLFGFLYLHSASLLCFVFSGPRCPGPWRPAPTDPSSVFFCLLLLSPPPCMFFPCWFLFLFFFLLPLVFFFYAVVCWLCGALWCRALTCWACWCVLLWALCFGGGCCALALCRSVCPACASPLCVVACCVARARWCSSPCCLRWVPCGVAHPPHL